MSGSDLRAERSTGAASYVRSLLIGGMMTCIVISLASLLRRVVPHWAGWHLGLLAFVVCVEGIAAERFTGGLSIAGRSRAELRVVECVIIMILLRVVLSLLGGWAQLTHDASRWVIDPHLVFDVEYLISGIVLLFVRFTGIGLAEDLQALEASPARDPAPRTTSNEFWFWITRPRGTADSIGALDRLSRTFRWGGVLLLLFAGLARLDVDLLFRMEHPSTPGVIVNALAYFLLGLALLSQAHYATLHSRWRSEGVEVSPRTGSRWALLGISFVAIVAVAATLLPLGYSTGLLRTLQSVLAWILYPIANLATGIFAAIVWLLTLLGQLIFRRDTDLQWQDRAPVRIEATPPPAGVEGWVDSLRSLFFWAILVFIVGYSFHQYFAARSGVWSRLRSVGLVRWFAALWQRIFRAGRRAAERAREGLETALRNFRPRVAVPDGRWRYVSLRSLSPRERVRYYYLSTLKRAARVGCSRGSSETPYEYQHALTKKAPQSETDVSVLTRAFVKARYDVQEFDASETEGAKQAWKRLKALLKQAEKRA